MIRVSTFINTSRRGREYVHLFDLVANSNVSGSDFNLWGEGTNARIIRPSENRIRNKLKHRVRGRATKEESLRQKEREGKMNGVGKD